MPCPCSAANGLECVFPIWFTQCGRVWFPLAMPCPCYAPTIPFFSRPRHSTSVERRPVVYLPAFGFFRLLRGIPRSCNQTHTNLRCRWPVWNRTPFVMDEEKSGSSTLLKKTICYSVGLAVRIFPATMRTFMKYTALSEQGRGAAWHVWINARHGRGTAWALHAVCESALSEYEGMNLFLIRSGNFLTTWNFYPPKKWLLSSHGFFLSSLNYRHRLWI